MAKTSEDDTVYVYVIGEESENVYGETLKKDYGKKWAVPDKIAPELYDDGDDKHLLSPKRTLARSEIIW